MMMLCSPCSLVSVCWSHVPLVPCLLISNLLPNLPSRIMSGEHCHLQVNATVYRHASALVFSLWIAWEEVQLAAFLFFRGLAGALKSGTCVCIGVCVGVNVWVLGVSYISESGRSFFTLEDRKITLLPETVHCHLLLCVFRSYFHSTCFFFHSVLFFRLGCCHSARVDVHQLLLSLQGSPLLKFLKDKMTQQVKRAENKTKKKKLPAIRYKNSVLFSDF